MSVYIHQCEIYMTNTILYVVLNRRRWRFRFPLFLRACWPSNNLGRDATSIKHFVAGKSLSDSPTRLFVDARHDDLSPPPFHDIKIGPDLNTKVALQSLCVSAINVYTDEALSFILRLGNKIWKMVCSTNSLCDCIRRIYLFVF